MTALTPFLEINHCYTLQERVGHDQFSDLWRASALYSPNQFLLRFLHESYTDPAAITLFRQEARRYFAFANDSFNGFIEVDFADGRLFVSSEYGSRILLSQWIEAGHRLTIQEACLNAIHLARLINQIHEKGLAFGSLNPECITVGPTAAAGAPGRFRIDIPSYSAFLASCKAQGRLPPSVQFFLAPEIEAGLPLRAASDLYSLGALLRLFLDDQPQRLVTAGGLANRRPDADRLNELDASGSLACIIDRARASDPEERFRNCGQFIEAIQCFLDERSWTAQPEPGDLSAEGLAQPAGSLTAAPSGAESGGRPEISRYFRELAADYLGWQGQPAGTADSGKIPVSHGQTPRPLPAKAAGYPTTDLKPLEAATVRPITPASLIPPSTELAASSLLQPPIPTKDPVPQNEALQPVLGQPASLAAPPDLKYNWHYRRLSFEQFTDAIRDTIRRCRRGTGDFRYIGEPDSLETLDHLDAFFESIADQCLLVDIGSMLRFGRADVTDFLTAFSQALARKLRQESRRSIGRFASLIERLGARAFFSAYPLGEMLYGANLDNVSPGKDDYRSIIQAMAIFGRRRKPLLFIVRGGECIQPELVGFFNAIIPLIAPHPVCFFILGENFPESLRPTEGRDQAS